MIISSDEFSQIWSSQAQNGVDTSSFETRYFKKSNRFRGKHLNVQIKLKIFYLFFFIYLILGSKTIDAKKLILFCSFKNFEDVL